MTSETKEPSPGVYRLILCSDLGPFSFDLSIKVKSVGEIETIGLIME